jgi:O-antigen/teichoic acid export membrane protein
VASFRSAAVYKRMGRNLAWLLGGKGFTGIASLGYLAVAARTLGPMSFGLFSLALAYGQAIASLVQFQSWQSVIRYGAGHMAADDDSALSRLLGFTASLDIATALTGAAIATIGVRIAGPLLGWSMIEQHRAALYGAALLLSVDATPSGILRLHDRFDLLAFAQAAAPTIRLLGAVTVWWFGGGVVAFLAVWATAAVSQSAACWIAALIKCDCRLAFGVRAFVQAVRENIGIWRFMLATNLSSSFGMLWQQIGTLAVGGAAGAAAAGGFRLAARLARGLAKPIKTVTLVLYPELARLVASDDGATLRRVATRVGRIALALAALLVLVAAMAGPSLLHAFAGHSFGFAKAFLILLAIASAINLSGFALDPLLTAHGRAGAVLAARGAGAGLYLLLLAVLLPTVGAIGAAVGEVGAMLVVRVMLEIATRRLLRRAMHGAGTASCS